MLKTNYWRSLVLCFILCLAISACNTADFEDDYDDDESPSMENGEGDYDDDDDDDEYDDENDEEEATSTNGLENGTTGEAVESSETWIMNYDQFIEDVVQDQLIPGAAVAVVYQGEIVYAKGFGWRDVENKLPVTTDTLFHIGSTNKSMTAMLVATLVDEGLFTWDTPIVEVYPAFTLSGATDTVTFRHLLSMSSGISADSEDDFDVDYGTAEELFDFVQDIDLLAPPGETFSYSNISASLAGYLAVLMANDNAGSLYEGYADLLTERVLRPVGMETAVVSLDDALKNPNYGKSYILSRNQWVEAEPADFVGDPFAPSGIVKASVMEMAFYIQTHLNQGTAPNGNQVVSAENMKVLWEPQLENYALGWDVSPYNGVEVISHEGAFDSYLSIIGFVPELELGYVILTNSEDTGEALLTDSPPYLIDQLLQK